MTKFVSNDERKIFLFSVIKVALKVNNFAFIPKKIWPELLNDFPHIFYSLKFIFIYSNES